MNANRSRVRASRDQAKLDLWSRRLQEFERRDCTVAVYCKELGVSTPTFYYWRRKLTDAPGRSQAKTRSKMRELADKRGMRGRKSGQSKFLPVKLSAQSGVENVSFELTSGSRIEVPATAQLALASVLDRVFV